MGISWFETKVSSDNVFKSGNQTTNYTGNQNTTSSGTQNTNQNTTSSGTTTPIIAPQFDSAFARTGGNLNASGLTPDQESALGLARSRVAYNPGAAAMYDSTRNLQTVKGQLNGVNDQWGALAGADPRQAAQSPSVMGRGTYSAVDPYRDLFSDELIDPSLAAFDEGTDRAFSALDARTAANGGFANSRSGLGYSDLASRSALERGKFASELKNLGLTNSLGYAQGDVNRTLGADQFNSTNIGDINKFNVTAGLQGDAQKMEALRGIQSTLAQQAGLTQQQAENIVTAEGLNTENAMALFAGGQISQQQLQQILTMAATYNGQSVSGTQNSAGTNTSSGTQDQRASGTEDMRGSSESHSINGSVGFK